MKIESNSQLIKVLLLFLGIVIISGCATKEKLYYAAPTLLPETERAMKTAGFWTGRNPCPDRIILDREGIETLNLYVRDELRLTLDITQLSSPFPGKEMTEKREEILAYYRGKRFYREDGSTLITRFYKELVANMNFGSVPSGIDIRYGLVVRYTDQRVFPTGEAIYAKPYDIDFDEFQNSALDIGTPVAVMHTSLDGKWYYVKDQLDSGWVPVENVALCSLDELEKFSGGTSFAVVIKPKGEIFLDLNMTVYYDYARMGAKFPLLEKEDSGIARIALPFRKEDGTLLKKVGYIRGEDVHKGYLSYTPRNIIRQAFELLNAPYGWGGMYGEQDCSRFVQEVFATVGISLPRNSSKQSQVGILIGELADTADETTRLDLLSQEAIGGCTLLYMRGHIMLFLGMVHDRPYAIHNPWAYRQKEWWGDKIRLINRVAVTDLSLGKGSKKGSFLERLCSIRLISCTDFNPL